MNRKIRSEYFSVPRFNRYLLSVEDDLPRAKKLYLANIRLAQAFHPLVTQFEVVLRNSLNNKLALHFSDQDWLINQDTGFMSDPSLSGSQYFLKRSVTKSKNDLRRRSVPITSGKILSNLTFGFWLAFYLRHHYRLVSGTPINVFNHKPSSENRASIYSKLDSVRDFRNRVNHSEPLCLSNQGVDYSSAEMARQTLYSLLSWIDPELVPFFERIDNVPSKINAILRI